MWKTIKDFSLYEINEFGVIRNAKTHYVTSQRMNKNGYLFVQLFDGKQNHMCLVHRLVAETFIPNPDNLPIVNHIDECSVHNSADNLEWISYKGNANHGTRNERIIRDRQDAVIAFDGYGTTISRFPSKREAARQYNVSENSIRAAIKNKNKCKQLYWRPDINDSKASEEDLNEQWIEESLNKTSSNKQSRKAVPVAAFSLNGELISSFSTIAEAARAMGVSNTAIATAIRLGTKCNSFLWKEIEEG